MRNVNEQGELPVQWTRSQLLNAPFQRVTFDAKDITIAADAFQNSSLINSAKNVCVSGEGYLDSQTDRFYVQMEIQGTMCVPDAISNEEIELPFQTESEQVYSFEETDEEDVRVASNEVVDLLPAVIQSILLEAPIQATQKSEEEYPSGDGWRVLSETSYQESQKDQIDPRLAKLKEWKQKK